MEDKNDDDIGNFNPYYPWDKEVLAEAVESVQEGKVSIEEASDEFSIPLAVLSQALSSQGDSHDQEELQCNAIVDSVVACRETDDSETTELMIMRRKLQEIEGASEQTKDTERILYIEPRSMNEEGDKKSMNSESVHSDDDAQSEEYFYLDNVDNKVQNGELSNQQMPGEQSSQRKDYKKVICMAVTTDLDGKDIDADHGDAYSNNSEDNVAVLSQLNMSWPSKKSNVGKHMEANVKIETDVDADNPWTTETLNSAYDEVMNGNLSQRQAARKYGIPRTTLQKYCSGVRSIAKITALGRKRKNAKVIVTSKRKYIKKMATRSMVKLEDIDSEVASLSPKERLAEAYRAAVDRKMPTKAASRYYGIPLSTLKGWASGRVKKPLFLQKEGQDDEHYEKKKSVAPAIKKPKQVECGIAEEYIKLDKMERMKLAYEAVISKAIPVKKASRTYGIARSTMRSWVSGKTKPSFLYEQKRTPISDSQIAKSREVFYKLINSGIIEKLEMDEAKASEQESTSNDKEFGVEEKTETSGECQISVECTSEIKQNDVIDIVSTRISPSSTVIQSPIHVRGKSPAYKPLDLINAYKDVVEKQTPIKRAARMYGVPKSTLQAWVKGKVKRPLCFQPVQKQSSPSNAQVAKSREIFNFLKYAFPFENKEEVKGTSITEEIKGRSITEEIKGTSITEEIKGTSITEEIKECTSTIENAENEPTPFDRTETENHANDRIEDESALSKSAIQSEFTSAPKTLASFITKPFVQRHAIKPCLYKAEDLLHAYKAVVEDQMPLKKAARTYKVPRSTLQCWVTGKVTMPKCFADKKIPGLKIEHKKPEPKKMFPVFNQGEENGTFNKAINMQLAYREVVFGHVPIKRAARMYGVPRTTLQNWVVGKTKMPLCLQQNKSNNSEQRRFDLSSKLLPLAARGQKDGSDPKQSGSGENDDREISGELAIEQANDDGNITGGGQFILGDGDGESSEWLAIYSKGRREYKPYTIDPVKQENLLQAYKSVIEDGMPVKRAARHYNVPRSTLQGWVKGKVKTPLFLRQAGDKSGAKRKTDTEGEEEDGVKKPRRKRNINRKPWSKEVMELAVKAIRDNKMPIRTAARIFDLPRSTLQDYLKGKTVEFKLGPNSILTVEEEKSLIGWITTSTFAGVVVSKEAVLDMVKKILNNKGKRGFRTVDNKPSENWFKKFVKKNEELRKIFTNIDDEPEEKIEGETQKRKPAKRKKKEKAENDCQHQQTQSSPPQAHTPLLLPRESIPMPPITTTALPNAATFTRELPPIPKTVGVTSMFFPRPGEGGMLTIPRSNMGNVSMAMNMVPDNIVSSSYQRPQLLNSAIEMLSRLPFVCSICGGPCTLNDQVELCIQCRPLPGSNTMRSCRGWFHVRCTELFNSHLSKDEIKRLHWSCPACTAVGLVQEYAHMT